MCTSRGRSSGSTGESAGVKEDIVTRLLATFACAGVLGVAAAAAQSPAEAEKHIAAAKAAAGADHVALFDRICT